MSSSFEFKMRGTSTLRGTQLSSWNLAALTMRTCGKVANRVDLGDARRESTVIRFRSHETYFRAVVLVLQAEHEYSICWGSTKLSRHSSSSTASNSSSLSLFDS